MFNPKQSPVTQQNDPAAPTVVNIPPQESYQQPQFGQQPSYEQPTFGIQAPPPARKFGAGRIIVGILVLVIGLISIIGGLGTIFMYSGSKSTASTNNSSNDNSSNYTST